MARGLLGDYLLTHRFHLLDVDFSLSVPPFVMWPQAGFSAITMPEMTVETEEIVEGTSPFKRHAVGKASVGPITLSRGSTVFNTDFWRWIIACLKGTPNKTDSMFEFVSELAKSAVFGSYPVPGKRRNLILIQLSGISADGLTDSLTKGDVTDKIKATAAMPAAGIQAGIDAIKSATQGYVDFGISSIPIKAWMLIDAIPTRYKPGSDFDATASEVSIQELEIQCERFEEFGLTL